MSKCVVKPTIFVACISLWRNSSRKLKIHPGGGCYLICAFIYSSSSRIIRMFTVFESPPKTFEARKTIPQNNYYYFFCPLTMYRTSYIIWSDINRISSSTPVFSLPSLSPITLRRHISLFSFLKSPLCNLLLWHPKTIETCGLMNRLILNLGTALLLLLVLLLVQLILVLLPL